MRWPKLLLFSKKMWIWFILTTIWKSKIIFSMTSQYIFVKFFQQISKSCDRNIFGSISYSKILANSVDGQSNYGKRKPESSPKDVQSILIVGTISFCSFSFFIWSKFCLIIWLFSIRIIFICLCNTRFRIWNIWNIWNIFKFFI